VFNGKLWFSGWDLNDHYNLWLTNGTAPGTFEIRVNGANTSGLAPHYFTALNGKLLFVGLNAAGKYGLWHTDEHRLELRRSQLGEQRQKDMAYSQLI
jgi:hypothetical protein